MSIAHTSKHPDNVFNTQKTNDIRFLFTSICLYEGPCVINVICLCLRIVVSNTYCFVLLFWFSTSCVLYVGSFFSGLSIFDWPFVIL